MDAYSSYMCFYRHYNDKGSFLKNQNTACYKEIDDHRYIDNGIEYIYIDSFYHGIFDQHIPLLLSVVNEITPCEIVIIDGTSYIKFKLLDTYKRSLIILNFVRYIWFSPRCYGLDPLLFNRTFYQELSDESCFYADPLTRLCAANHKAIVACKIMSYTGHANTYNPNLVRDFDMLTVDALKNFYGNDNTSFFATP